MTHVEKQAFILNERNKDKPLSYCTDLVYKLLSYHAKCGIVCKLENDSRYVEEAKVKKAQMHSLTVLYDCALKDFGLFLEFNREDSESEYSKNMNVGYPLVVEKSGGNNILDLWGCPHIW